MNRQYSRGDRHMRTDRRHNRRPLVRRTARPLTAAERAERLHGIGNRGVAMKPELDLELPCVVCITVEDSTLFDDNERGACTLCGTGVQHRPHIPKPSQLICIQCWLDLVKEEDSIEIGVTPETLAEVSVIFGKLLN